MNEHRKMVCKSFVSPQPISMASFISQSEDKQQGGHRTKTKTKKKQSYKDLYCSKSNQPTEIPYSQNRYAGNYASLYQNANKEDNTSQELGYSQRARMKNELNRSIRSNYSSNTVRHFRRRDKFKFFSFINGNRSRRMTDKRTISFNVRLDLEPNSLMYYNDGEKGCKGVRRINKNNKLTCYNRPRIDIDLDGDDNEEGEGNGEGEDYYSDNDLFINDSNTLSKKPNNAQLNKAIRHKNNNKPLNSSFLCDQSVKNNPLMKQFIENQNEVLNDLLSSNYLNRSLYGNSQYNEDKSKYKSQTKNDNNNNVSNSDYSGESGGPLVSPSPRKMKSMIECNQWKKFNSSNKASFANNPNIVDSSSQLIKVSANGNVTKDDFDKYKTNSNQKETRIKRKPSIKNQNNNSNKSSNKNQLRFIQDGNESDKNKEKDIEHEEPMISDARVMTRNNNNKNDNDIRIGMSYNSSSDFICADDNFIVLTDTDINGEQGKEIKEGSSSKPGISNLKLQTNNSSVLNKDKDIGSGKKKMKSMTEKSIKSINKGKENKEQTNNKMEATNKTYKHSKTAKVTLSKETNKEGIKTKSDKVITDKKQLNSSQIDSNSNQKKQSGSTSKTPIGGKKYHNTPQKDIGNPIGKSIKSNTKPQKGNMNKDAISLTNPITISMKKEENGKERDSISNELSKKGFQSKQHNKTPSTIINAQSLDQICNDSDKVMTLEINQTQHSQSKDKERQSIVVISKDISTSNLNNQLRNNNDYAKENDSHRNDKDRLENNDMSQFDTMTNSKLTQDQRKESNTIAKNDAIVVNHDSNNNLCHNSDTVDKQKSFLSNDLLAKDQAYLNINNNNIKVDDESLTNKGKSDTIELNSGKNEHKTYIEQQLKSNTNNKTNIIEKEGYRNNNNNENLMNSKANDSQKYNTSDIGHNKELPALTNQSDILTESTKALSSQRNTHEKDYKEFECISFNKAIDLHNENDKISDTDADHGNVYDNKSNQEYQGPNIKCNDKNALEGTNYDKTQYQSTQLHNDEYHLKDTELNNTYITSNVYISGTQLNSKTEKQLSNDISIENQTFSNKSNKYKGLVDDKINNNELEIIIGMTEEHKEVNTVSINPSGNNEIKEIEKLLEVNEKKRDSTLSPLKEEETINTCNSNENDNDSHNMKIIGASLNERKNTHEVMQIKYISDQYPNVNMNTKGKHFDKEDDKENMLLEEYPSSDNTKRLLDNNDNTVPNPTIQTNSNQSNMQTLNDLIADKDSYSKESLQQSQMNPQKEVETILNTTNVLSNTFDIYSNTSKSINMPLKVSSLIQGNLNTKLEKNVNVDNESISTFNDILLKQSQQLKANQSLKQNQDSNDEENKTLLSQINSTNQLINTNTSNNNFFSDHNVQAVNNNTTKSLHQSSKSNTRLLIDTSNKDVKEDDTKKLFTVIDSQLEKINKNINSQGQFEIELRLSNNANITASNMDSKVIVNDTLMNQNKIISSLSKSPNKIEAKANRDQENKEESFNDQLTLKPVNDYNKTKDYNNLNDSHNDCQNWDAQVLSKDNLDQPGYNKTQVTASITQSNAVNDQNNANVDNESENKDEDDNEEENDNHNDEVEHSKPFYKHVNEIQEVEEELDESLKNSLRQSQSRPSSLPKSKAFPDLHDTNTDANMVQFHTKNTIKAQLSTFNKPQLIAKETNDKSLLTFNKKLLNVNKINTPIIMKSLKGKKELIKKITNEEMDKDKGSISKGILKGNKKINDNVMISNKDTEYKYKRDELAISTLQISIEKEKEIYQQTKYRFVIELSSTKENNIKVLGNASFRPRSFNQDLFQIENQSIPLAISNKVIEEVKSHSNVEQTKSKPPTSGKNINSKGNNKDKGKVSCNEDNTIDTQLNSFIEKVKSKNKSKEVSLASIREEKEKEIQCLKEQKELLSKQKLSKQTSSNNKSNSEYNIKANQPNVERLYTNHTQRYINTQPQYDTAQNRQFSLKKKQHNNLQIDTMQGTKLTKLHLPNTTNPETQLTTKGNNIQDDSVPYQNTLVFTNPNMPTSPNVKYNINNCNSNSALKQLKFFDTSQLRKKGNNSDYYRKYSDNGNKDKAKDRTELSQDKSVYLNKVKEDLKLTDKMKQINTVKQKQIKLPLPQVNKKKYPSFISNIIMPPNNLDDVLELKNYYIIDQ